MGSRIACHFANCGMQVLLLDLLPKEISEEEKRKGLTAENPKFRNGIADRSLAASIASNPSPLYLSNFKSSITTGNFTDHLKEIGACDLIVEAIIENLEIKQALFSEVEKYRKPGTPVCTNTSGIPIQQLIQNRSADFKAHFLGTHFFNPPRYLPLLEIIPSQETKQEVVSAITNWGIKILGKTTVRCNDTPAFIANRIGVFAIMALFHAVDKHGFSVDEVEKFTGPLIGRPKSATFRTCDLVGIDTIDHVAKGLFANAKTDERIEDFKNPPFLQSMLDNKWFGDKTKQGFFKKTKNEAGKSEILVLDLKTLTYGQRKKIKIPSIEQALAIEDLKERIKFLVNAKDRAGDFFRLIFSGLLAYASNRVPEISGEPSSVDEAMKAGFGWTFGPFETWDAIGLKEGLEMIRSAGLNAAPWVAEMARKGKETFYNLERGRKTCFVPGTMSEETVNSSAQFLLLENIAGNIVWKNAGSTIHDLGDGILNLSFHTKMNTIGSEIIEGLRKGIEMAESNFKGLVIANEGEHFSAGANLALVFMYATQQEFEEIDMAVRVFQKINSNIKYARVPVVVAPHGLTLGGGCEMCLHAPAVVADAETYTGLVEFGVGLIPGGGGTKEMVIRTSDAYLDGEIGIPALRRNFLTIGTAKVSTSGMEAFEMGLFRKGTDEIAIHRKFRIKQAKQKALLLSEAGYSPPQKRKDIRVPGKTGLGVIQAGANAMEAGKYISAYDRFISEKLGFIMCGGNLSGPALVSEEYLLDLEREAFLSLCAEPKTQQRIQSILTTGKPLRN